MIDTSARLIAVSYVGELGVARRVETPTSILCEISSVNRTEFYAAYNSGFRPEWRVVTDPVNYTGQTLIEIDAPEGAVRCDIFRTYRKSLDSIELMCCLHNPEAVQTFTLFAGGRKFTLFGAYMTGSDGALRQETGAIAMDNVTLVLPQTLQAFDGATPVAYARPKAYAAMSTADKAKHFFIDAGCFFALGDLADVAADSKYQAVNAAHDDVYRVQSVVRRSRGKPDTEFLEVIGR